MKLTPTSTEFRGILLMLASVLFFACTALLLSYVNRSYDINGWVASFYRAIIGLAVVFTLQRSTGKLTLQRIVTQPWLLVRGLLGGATIPVYYITIMELGPGRAGILGGSYPLFAALFAAWFLGECLPRRYSLYITLAFVGLIAVVSGHGLGSSSLGFDILALAGAATAGICVVLIRHLRHTETTSNIFASQCVFTLLITSIACGNELLITNPRAFALTLLAAFTVVAAQLCITESFRHINVAKGSTLQMLTPVVTVIGSTSLLGESFSLVEIFGGTAILFASYKIVTARCSR